MPRANSPPYTLLFSNTKAVGTEYRNSTTIAAVSIISPEEAHTLMPKCNKTIKNINRYALA